jgi:hypothetical protein
MPWASIRVGGRKSLISNDARGERIAHAREQRQQHHHALLKHPHPAGGALQDTVFVEVSQRVRRPLCNRMAGCTAHPRSVTGQVHEADSADCAYGDMD